MYKFLGFDILDLEKKNDIGHGVLNQINKTNQINGEEKRK